MENKLKVAYAQINFQPSYVGINGYQMDEPTTFTSDGAKTLSSLPSTNEVRNLKSHMRKYNLSNLKVKIESILDYCSSKQVNLVVFPEYSVPVQLIEMCYEYSKQNEIIIIAGSHSVVNSQESNGIYEKCQLFKKGKLGGLDSLEDSVRKAVCPIFTPNGENYIVQKITQSKWEGEMVVDDRWETITVNYPGVSVRIAVLLCIDALSEEKKHILYENGLQDADLIIIPSYSPSTTPFENVALLNLLNEKPTVYCNVAEYGGSRIYANHGSSSADLFLVNNGTIETGKQETVVGVELNLSGQFQKKGSSKTYVPVRSLFCAPVVYCSNNTVFDSYSSELNGILLSWSLEKAKNLIERYLVISGSHLPDLMRTNLSRARDMVEEGRATSREVLLLYRSRYYQKGFP